MRSQNPIRHVIFDLAEVLIQGLLNISPILAKELSVPEQTILPGLRKLLNEYMEGKMSETEFWTDIIASNGWHADLNTLKTIVRRHFRSQIPGTGAILRAVAEDYPVYLLSDMSLEWMQYVRKTHNFFDVLQVVIVHTILEH